MNQSGGDAVRGRGERSSEPVRLGEEMPREIKTARRRTMPPTLTRDMKNELMSLALKKVEDPWSEKNEQLLQGFCGEVKKIVPGDKDASLVEFGTMLEGSTKIFAAQADEVHQRVLAYRDQLVQSRKEREDAAARIVAAREAERANAERELANANAERERANAAAINVVENVAAVPPPPVNALEAAFERMEVNFVEVKIERLGDPEVTEKNPATDSGIESEPCTDESQEIMSDIEGPNTRKRTETLMNILNTDENGEPIVKKPRNGIILHPPSLISCHEELEELLKSGLMCSNSDIDLKPPVLDLAVRISRQKSVFYTEEKFKEEKRPHEIVVKADRKVISKSVDETQKILDSNATVHPLRVIAEGLSVSAANAATFSTEDQAAIQECINELHYLPFTFELSKADLASAFNRTVERMTRIFQKNNVEVTRNMVKAASVIPCNSLVKEPDKPSGSNGVIVHPAAISLGEIYNTFVKSCREECETFMSNSKVIIDCTKEKSFAESRANIRAMIAELQRNIVPKFARVPLMAENTPEFFQHVTMFEKRMKKVLEEEAKKEEFDVRKYEREVLEVTVKESNELEGSVCEDMFLVPQSPVKTLSIDRDIAEMMAASPSTRSSFDGSQSSSGGGWVPLRNIFHHMKNIDKTEAARLFYAVLALLSYQNLDMNYDQLYSAESAALITKQLQTLNSKDDDLDNKFHRGVKICTSRCPDIDKEEVFVSALTAESRDEAFRHLLAEDVKNSNSGSNPVAGSSSSGRVIDEGIAEAMADFIEESGSMFQGRLESKKRKKKVDTS